MEGFVTRRAGLRRLTARNGPPAQGSRVRRRSRSGTRARCWREPLHHEVSLQGPDASHLTSSPSTHCVMALQSGPQCHSACCMPWAALGWSSANGQDTSGHAGAPGLGCGVVSPDLDSGTCAWEATTPHRTGGRAGGTRRVIVATRPPAPGRGRVYGMTQSLRMAGWRRSCRERQPETRSAGCDAAAAQDGRCGGSPSARRRRGPALATAAGTGSRSGHAAGGPTCPQRRTRSRPGVPRSQQAEWHWELGCRAMPQCGTDKMSDD